MPFYILAGSKVLALLTSKSGKNLLSFSTTVTVCGPALSIDLVSAPGPGPTSHTQECGLSLATLTILSETMSFMTVDP